jgi:hypothetical protein
MTELLKSSGSLNNSRHSSNKKEVKPYHDASDDKKFSFNCVNLKSSRNEFERINPNTHEIFVEMKPMENTVKKPDMKHSYNQKRVIKTEQKPKGKATMITRKPVVEVKIDLSSTQQVPKLSADLRRSTFQKKKPESYDQIYGTMKPPILGIKSTR